MRPRKAVRRTLAPLGSVVVAALLAGCAIPIIGARSFTSNLQPNSTVSRVPWGPEYDGLAALVEAAMDEMEPTGGFVLRIPPQPTPPVENTARWTVVDEGRTFSRGNYRLIAYCAGSGTVYFDISFQLGSLFSTGTGNFVTCHPGTAVNASEIELPVGANHLRIEVNPVDMYGNPTEPRAAIAFTIERSPG